MKSQRSAKNKNSSVKYICHIEFNIKYYGSNYATDHDATDRSLSRNEFLTFPFDSGGNVGPVWVAAWSATDHRRKSAPGEVLNNPPYKNHNDSCEEDYKTRGQVVEPVARLQAILGVVAALRCCYANGHHFDQSDTLWSQHRVPISTIK